MNLDSHVNALVGMDVENVTESYWIRMAKVLLLDNQIQIMYDSEGVAYYEYGDNYELK